MTPETTIAARRETWQQKLARRRGLAETARTLVVEGSLRRVVGLTLEAEGCEAALGARCLVDTADGATLDTEVVGCADERLLLMPVATCTACCRMRGYARARAAVACRWARACSVG